METSHMLHMCCKKSEKPSKINYVVFVYLDENDVFFYEREENLVVICYLFDHAPTLARDRWFSKRYYVRFLKTTYPIVSIDFIGMSMYFSNNVN